jgi:hypothetical protein
MKPAASWRTELVAREVCEIDGIDKLEQPLAFYSALLDAQITAPAGFHTDYASVPRLPFAYLVVGGKGRKAAVIHDFLYSGGMVYGMPLKRDEADAVFAEALKATGYGPTVVNLMYAGVRLGGWWSFKDANLAQPEAVADRMVGTRPLLVEAS